MAILKNVLPVQLDKYDALFRFQTKDFTSAEIDLAMTIAEPIVASLLSSR